MGHGLGHIIHFLNSVTFVFFQIGWS